MEVRDFGLSASAVARPAATTFGQDARPELYTKAAALPHSLTRNHALVEGNERTAWVFLEINGEGLDDDFDEDASEALVLTAAQGAEEVPEIAASLRTFRPHVRLPRSRPT